jgi:hypothetical protein
MSEYYRFHCEICNWTKVSKTIEEANLFELPAPPIPGGKPHFNASAKAWESAKPLKRSRRFRCPGCGRVVTAKPTAAPPTPPTKKVADEDPDAVEVLGQSIRGREEHRANKPITSLPGKIAIDHQGIVL